jgi:hypothetical protein
MRVSGPTDRLAALCQMDRHAFRRALTTLEAGGFCLVSATKGHGAVASILITTQYYLSHETVTSSVGGPPTSGQSVENQLEVLETSEESCQIPSVGAHFTSAPSRLSDQDLLGSGVSDPDPSSEISGRPRSYKDLNNYVPTLAVGSEESAPRSPGRQPDPDKVPDRAFAAADYLRACVLKEAPASAIARRRWTEAKSGVRLQWANGFRLLNQVDKREWDDIARTVKWLFEGQTAAARFVVQCPTSLREKWDRIAAVRRNQDTAKKFIKPTEPVRVFRRIEAPEPTETPE